jgi:hypothetical protein
MEPAKLTSDEMKAFLILRIEANKATEKSKQIIIEQVKTKEEVNEKEYLKAVQCIPQILRNQDKIKKIEKTIKKASVKLERHQYAPELNMLVLKSGRTIRAKDAETIEQAVKIAALKEYQFQMINLLNSK